MSRSLRAIVAALFTALLAVTTLGAPAHADPDRLRLSIDSAGPFTEDLTTPLFSGSYVPGTATSSFYVMNDSPSTTRATISVAPKSTYNTFERALSFSASVGGVQGTSVPLYEDKKKNQCRTIVTGPTIAPGAVQKIDVTMIIDPNFSQPPSTMTASFSFVVTLSQVTNKGKVDVCGTQSPGGTVEVLGAGAKAASFTPPSTDPQHLSEPLRSADGVLLVAAGLLAAGAMLLVGRRRRRRTD